MSAGSFLSVVTCAGLTLELRHDTSPTGDGDVSGTLLIPRSRAAGTSPLDLMAAFLAGGRAGIDVRLDPRTSKHWPTVLWIRGAAIDIDDDTAATVQAWLDSRPSVEGRQAEPAPAALQAAA